MKIQYINYAFQKKTLAIINQANAIIEEYHAQDFVLTLRQLYYQFVARDLIPNTQKEYSKLGSVISKARLAGLIDWKAIDDRTRKDQGNSHWSGPSEIIQTAAFSYGIDTRSTQDIYLEVWIEKDALVGILEKSCQPLDIRYLSCRGYISQSAMWKAAMRLKRKEDDGQRTIILHFGDHDPSGIDMTRDIQDRLEIFGCDTKVKRIALSMDQVNQYNPPPNPAKITDSRYESYVTRFGADSWELDALDPNGIIQLIEEAVAGFTDEAARNERIELQEKHRTVIQYVADNWQDIMKENGK